MGRAPIWPDFTESAASSLFPADTTVDPSLQDKQRQLKKARLADGLNDRLSHRPGPLELVKGNILQTDASFAQAIKGEPRQRRVHCNVGTASGRHFDGLE